MEVLGEGAANLPAVMKILIEVFQTDMVDDETSTAISQLVKALGQEKLAAMAGALSAKEQKKLERIFKA